MGQEMGVTLAGMKLPHPIGIAAGMIKTLSDVREAAEKSVASFIAVGSITREPRALPTGTTYYPSYSSGYFSLNSRNLVNDGISVFLKDVIEMVRIAHEYEKKIFVSIAGSSPADYAVMVAMLAECGFDMITLNFGCSNRIDGGKQQPIPSYEPRMIREILARVRDIKVIRSSVRSLPPLAVKLSPLDPFRLAEVAEEIVASGIINAVVTCNTWGNAFAFAFNRQGERVPAITPNRGLAGLGSKALFPIMLGQVVQFRDLLPEHIDIIAVGGIDNHEDVADALRAGATAVKVGTNYFEYGPEKVPCDMLLND